MFNRSKSSFDVFGELLTRISCNPFDPLHHPTIRADDESDRSLGHTKVVLRCAI